MFLVALMLQQPEGGGPVESIARTFGVDWPHLLAQLVSFAIVCVALYWFAYRPVLRMLESRRQQIAQGLANTEKINAALANIESQRQQVMADAQAQAAQFLAEARAMAKRVQEQETQRAIAAAEQILAKAREASAQEHQQMLAELRAEVGRLVVQTTSAVIGRVVTPDDQRRLAEDAARYLQAS
jgi:F-type H+-transporting ATPase subunit b